MHPILLSAHIKPMLWGGTRLAEFGFDLSNFDCSIGEAWTCSVHQDGQSLTADPVFSGKTLYELWQQYPEWFGVSVDESFPLLIKWIDAQEDLSVQVHPDDKTAQQLEGQLNGKSEFWYIVAAKEGASIIFGHDCVDADALYSAIAENRIMEHLQRVPVKAGDWFYVPSGTVHALMAGCLVLEVQQSSNITYRLYDYDRLDVKTGVPRPLHIDKGIASTHFSHNLGARCENYAEELGLKPLTRNAYFFVDKLTLQQKNTTRIIENGSGFSVLTVIDGSINIEGVDYFVGATLLLPAKESFTITGVGTAILAGVNQKLFI